MPKRAWNTPAHVTTRTMSASVRSTLAGSWRTAGTIVSATIAANSTVMMLRGAKLTGIRCPSARTTTEAAAGDAARDVTPERCFQRAQLREPARHALTERADQRLALVHEPGDQQTGDDALRDRSHVRLIAHS